MKNRGCVNRTAVGIAVAEALRRYPACPQRTLARYLVKTQGILFEDDFEKAYGLVRYYSGKKGDTLRSRASDKTLFKKNVKLPISRAAKRSPFLMEAGSWLVLSDIHIPFHDTKALEAAVSFGQKRKVDGIYLCEVMDAQALSFWPSKSRDFPMEVEATTDFLDWLKQEFPKAKMVYQQGNHDERLTRYCMANAPELLDMPTADLDMTLGLDARGITLLEEKQVAYFGKLPVFHGHELRIGRGSVSPARALFNKCHTSAACGHLHSTSENSTRNVKGELLTTFSWGCLSDLNPDYCSSGNQWNHGAALIDVEDNGSYHVENRRITESGKMV